jgi:hypothetical protein
LLGLALDCDPIISASQVAGITNMYHHAQSGFFFFFLDLAILGIELDIFFKNKQTNKLLIFPEYLVCSRYHFP